MMCANREEDPSAIGSVATVPPRRVASRLRDGTALLDSAYDVLAVALIAAALIAGLHAARGVDAAGDLDLFRDIAQAQTVRDGHPLTDPYYRQEWAWYNPLLAWTLALGSHVAGTSVERFQANAGVWLNLLGPIGFYLLGVRLAGRRAAVAALTLYLFFLAGNERSWACATYSPWLFAANFAQGIFYLAGLALIRTDSRPTNGCAVAAGGLMGVAFLAHTAPAVILAVIASVMFASRRRTLLVIASTAFVVASPFLLPLAVHYRFHVVHPAPVRYEYPPLSLAEFPATLKRYALPIGLAAAGAWRLRSTFARLWLAVPIALLAYTWTPLPPLLPGYHFWLYTTAALALLGGVTLAWVCRWPFAFFAATAVLVIWNWPAYASRGDVRSFRFYAQQRQWNHREASAFLRTITRPDDVVVGTYGAVRLIIGPAGRKTLAPDPNFANPYRDFESRAADRDVILKTIAAGDLTTARTIARRYSASAVVLSGLEDCEAAMRILPVSWRVGDVCILMLD